MPGSRPAASSRCPSSPPRVSTTIPIRIDRLERFDLLILDDITYVSKDQAESSVLIRADQRPVTAMNSAKICFFFCAARSRLISPAQRTRQFGSCGMGKLGGIYRRLLIESRDSDISGEAIARKGKGSGEAMRTAGRLGTHR